MQRDRGEGNEMRIKQFIGCAILYIAVVGIITFIENANSYKTSFFGLEIELPVVVWVLAPLVLFALFALLHIMFAGIGIYSKKRALQTDSNTFKSSAKDLLLGLESDRNFKTEYYKDAVELAKVLSPYSDGEAKLSSDELNSAFEMVKSVKNGEFIDIKRFKLPKNNPIRVQNDINRIQNDPKFINQILGDRINYNDEVVNAAQEALVRKGSFLDIKKQGIPEDKESVHIIFERFMSEEGFEIAKDDLYKIIANLELDENEYIKLFRMLKNKYTPEALLPMFEKLKNDNPTATQSYYYALYELGMIDELRNQLYFADSEKNEKFEILLFLRDNGKSIPASYLFS